MPGYAVRVPPRHSLESMNSLMLELAGAFADQLETHLPC